MFPPFLLVRSDVSAKPYEAQNITAVAAGPDFQVREFDVASGEEVPKHFTKVSE